MFLLLWAVDGFWRANLCYWLWFGLWSLKMVFYESMKYWQLLDNYSGMTLRNLRIISSLFVLSFFESWFFKSAGDLLLDDFTIPLARLKPQQGHICIAYNWVNENVALLAVRTIMGVVVKFNSYERFHIIGANKKIHWFAVDSWKCPAPVLSVNLMI